MHKYRYNTMAEKATIPEEPKYKRTKSNVKSNGTSQEVSRSFKNKVQRGFNRLSYKANGITLASDRIKRGIQKAAGVSDDVLQEKFANVYEWEKKNPKKTKAISQIQKTQEGDRATTNDESRAPQDRAVSSFREMIKEIIINMLGGTKHKDAVNYHNGRNQNNKIDEGSEMDKLINKTFSNVKDGIKNDKFNVNIIDNKQLNQAMLQHISINGNNQMQTQVISTIVLQQQGNYGKSAQNCNPPVQLSALTKSAPPPKTQSKSNAMNNNAFGDSKVPQINPSKLPTIEDKIVARPNNVLTISNIKNVVRPHSAPARLGGGSQEAKTKG